MIEEKILEQFFVWLRANGKGKIVPEITSNDSRAKFPNICSIKRNKELFRRDITSSIANSLSSNSLFLLAFMVTN